MDIALVIIFLLLGILFFMLEIFFLPGISVGGVAGTAFVVAGVWYAFAKLGVLAGWLSVLTGLIVFGLAIWLFLKGKVLDKMSLTTNLGATEIDPSRAKLKVGDVGTTISRLAPMGKVLFGDVETEVKTQAEFVDAGCEVEIIEFENNILTVRQLNK